MITGYVHSVSFFVFDVLILQIRTFRYLTGKLTRVFDESLKTFTELQQMRQQLPDMEFGRRLAAERDLQKSELFSTANISEYKP